jgi:hypothetical protein
MPVVGLSFGNLKGLCVSTATVFLHSLSLTRSREICPAVRLLRSAFWPGSSTGKIEDGYVSNSIYLCVPQASQKYVIR